MRGRSPLQSLAASPTMVGAVTVLIAIVAVFLAYNANNGLPFVPTYQVSVEVPNAARLTSNNEVRIGGHRVGVVASIEPIQTDQSQTTAASDGTVAQDTASDTGGVAAQLNLKLDKAAEPLPQDSIFRVRYRSAFGLKYLEIVRGTGPDAPEGYVFDGTDDGGVCTLPSSDEVSSNPETNEDEAGGSSANGCFQEQTEFDDIADTFDSATRENARENLLGFGNAFAGRGFSLNLAIEKLKPLLVNLRPVADVLIEPTTEFEDLFPALGRAAQIVAPVAEEQAELFTFAATTFAAISSDPAKLQETITEGVATLDAGIRTLPDQASFLRDATTLARALNPGVADLRVTLPTLNEAINVGTPVLARSVPFNRDLRGALHSLRDLVDQPSTRTALMRLGETFDTAAPLARWVVPAQTNCNYFNYWFTNVPNGFSDADQVGWTFRQALTNYPLGKIGTIFPGLGEVTVPGMVQTPVGGYSGVQANGKTGDIMPPNGSTTYANGDFAPYVAPIAYAPAYGPSGQNLTPDVISNVFPGQPLEAQSTDDCQAGQNGYPLGVPTDENGNELRLPGQDPSNPTIGIADFPGSAGPTQLFWTEDSGRHLVDSRVENRQPQTWDKLAP
jgi:ABC-type transporter Mla subunit MlaD